MRIGILTPGGDAAGCNAAIRATALSALHDGHEVIGLLDGWSGLLPGGSSVPLDDVALKGCLTSGGTMLGSIRARPMNPDRGFQILADGIEFHRLDAVVAIGGNGTLGVANVLASRGAPLVGIPKTVDFDVGVTDVCIGFESAVSVVADSVERMGATASSHHRILVCEVMGRDTGWLALMGGLAGGADMVLIPEVRRSFDEIMEQLEARRAAGHHSSVVVVAEGANLGAALALPEHDHIDASGHVELARREIGAHLADAITNSSDIETRWTSLGYIQRGGRPIASDRIWATRLGVAAYRALRDGQLGSCVVALGSGTAPVPMGDVVAEPKQVPTELVDLFNTLT